MLLRGLPAITSACGRSSSRAHVRVVSTAAAGRRPTKRDTPAAEGKSAPAGEDEAAWAAKQSALRKILEDIEADYGVGSVMQLGQLGAQAAKVETFSSGALTLDVALGGGLPKGRIVEIYGPESSGKTTLALLAISEVQRRGGVAAFIDAEHAFDPVYAAKVGVDVSAVVICQPESGEMALEVVDRLIRSDGVNLVCVDSVSALVPRAEIEGEIGQTMMGAQARLMSQALRKITTNAAKHGCTVIFLNQLRQKIGIVFGNPEITSGGNALKFYASVRLDIRRMASIKGSDESIVGSRVKVKVVKNKVAPPYRIAELDIYFGTGVSRAGTVLDAAETAGLVQRKGAWYSYNDEKLGQGRDKAVQALFEKPELAALLETEVRKRIAEILAGPGLMGGPAPSDAGDGDGESFNETEAETATEDMDT